MSDRIYCYPGTDILKNKFDIHDSEQLIRLERKLTMLRILELLDKPVKGDFNLKHLQNIHRYIFQDLYEWAGEIRTVDIAKGNMFCNVMFLQDQATDIFSKLKVDNYLHDYGMEEFVSKLAFYFSEINALHPFREGNGRTQREFIRALALHNGYKINFANTTKEEMLEASEKSFFCDYSAMENLFWKCIEK